MEDTIIEDVLQTAQKFYVQKDYQSALKTLDAARGKVSDGVWHYNVGTVYGQMGDWSLARFHFLSAIENGFVDKPVLQNRDLAEEKLGVTKLEKPLSAIDYSVKAALAGTQGIFTTISLVILISGLVAYFRKSSAKVFLSLITLSASVLILNWWVTSWDKYIVVQTQNIHDGPSTIFASSAEIPAGVFVVTKRNGEWMKIIYPSRFQGWIKFSGLKELK